MMRKCPCKDCEHRKMNCHGQCKAYQDWKGERTKIIDGLYKEQQLDVFRIDIARKQWRDMRYTYSKYRKKK